jgi:hypothetical protein
MAGALYVLGVSSNADEPDVPGGDDVIPGAVPPDAAPGERAPFVARARARVNRPPPEAKSFGVGTPAFTKLPARSPGASPPSERRPILPLPGSGAERPPEISKPPPGALARGLARLRGFTLDHGLVVLAAVVGTAFLYLVFRAKGRA